MTEPGERRTLPRLDVRVTVTVLRGSDVKRSANAAVAVTPSSETTNTRGAYTNTPGFGSKVGSSVGDGVGIRVGEGTGTTVGAVIGAAVGTGIGTAVGAANGTADGEGIGVAVAAGSAV